MHKLVQQQQWLCYTCETRCVENGGISLQKVSFSLWHISTPKMQYELSQNAWRFAYHLTYLSEYAI